jgi:glycosyltransferase involved in cell wall biosynthesis
MITPKVSVIIPVYNTSPYLRRCMDSITGQTLRDIEIVCINDGSSDDSLEILREYEAKDSRVRVIDFSENRGVSVARNTGMDAAQGEYIGFVDSDDYVDADFYEKLYAKAVETGAEIIKGADWQMITGNKITIERLNSRIKKNRVYFSQQYVTALFKTRFIREKGIHFPVGLLVGEDQVFSITAALRAVEICFAETAQYYYFRRENSVNSTKWSSDKCVAFADSRLQLLQVLHEDAPDNHTYAVGISILLADTRHVIDFKTDSAKDREFLQTVLSQIEASRKKIRLLFSAGIFNAVNENNSRRSGIFFVAWNLFRCFAADDRFEITLFLSQHNPMLKEKLNNLSFLKDFPVVSGSYAIARGKKLINNPTINEKNYDAFIGVTSEQVHIHSAIPVFLVLHDTIPLIFPYYFDVGNQASFYSAYAYMFRNKPYCFCVSQSCKDDFLHFFPYLDPEKMLVTPNAAAENFYPLKDYVKLSTILAKYGVFYPSPPKYLFSLCTLELRKNLLFTLDCFLKFIAKHQIEDLYFYLGGGYWESFKTVLVQKLATYSPSQRKKIVFLGYVEDDDLAILFSHSLFFTYLSKYEGFGMPPLEAMSCGTPVITSNTSALPEVVGDAGILVDPCDEVAVIGAFEDLYFNENRRTELQKKGLARKKMFSWKKTYATIAETIIRICEGICGENL